jgi:hypothetical protein
MVKSVVDLFSSSAEPTSRGVSEEERGLRTISIDEVPAVNEDGRRGKRTIDDVFERIRLSLIKSERRKPPQERSSFLLDLENPRPSTKKYGVKPLLYGSQLRDSLLSLLPRAPPVKPPPPPLPPMIWPQRPHKDQAASNTSGHLHNGIYSKRSFEEAPSQLHLLADVAAAAAAAAENTVAQKMKLETTSDSVESYKHQMDAPCTPPERQRIMALEQELVATKHQLASTESAKDSMICELVKSNAALAKATTHEDESIAKDVEYYNAFLGYNPHDYCSKKCTDEEAERLVEFAQCWMPPLKVRRVSENLPLANPHKRPVRAHSFDV